MTLPDTRSRNHNDESYCEEQIREVCQEESYQGKAENEGFLCKNAE